MNCVLKADNPYFKDEHVANYYISLSRLIRDWMVGGGGGCKPLIMNRATRLILQGHISSQPSVMTELRQLQVALPFTSSN